MTNKQESVYRDLVLALEIAESEKEREEILSLIHTAQQEITNL